jgi:hypothetical protein
MNEIIVSIARCGISTLSAISLIERASVCDNSCEGESEGKIEGRQREDRAKTGERLKGKTEGRMGKDRGKTQGRTEGGFEIR